MSRTRRILIVDDNPAMLAATVRLLVQVGYEVLQAVNGQEALRLTHAHHPDLVLLDVVLPDIEGTEVLRRIKADPELSDVMVMLRSGLHIKPEQQASGLFAGADGYLASPVGNQELLARVHALLRQREISEQQLLASEARFRGIFACAATGIAIITPEGHFRETNPAFCGTFGYSAAELQTLDLAALVHPEGRARTMALIAKNLAGAADSFIIEERCLKNGGASLWLRASVSIVRSPDGAPASLIAVTQDITEWKQSEETMAEQAALLDKARDAILVRDLEHHISFWNRSAERLYGWTAPEAIGRKASELLYENPASFEQAMKIVLEKGDWYGELEQVDRSGRKLLVEGRWTLVRDKEDRPRGILAINTDITERKSLEAQFLRAQRMESIGTLAGGIAHDLNNVLTPITMSVELLKMGLADQDSLDILATIEASARRAAEMVRQVLSFARGAPGRRLVVQTRRLLEDIQSITGETFPRNIEIKVVRGHELWPLSGDPTQLHQVLLNLCVNARDAMPDGGSLTIGAENVMLDEHYAAMNMEARTGPHVVFRVEDTGTGIPQPNIDKIFDPFFTTKEPGQGTGLGLSTSLAIVKSHGGFLRVYSEVGKGTTFKVYLPAPAAAQAQAAPGTEVILPRGHGEVVLVVDDEAAIRQITRQTLEAFGYRVMLAEGGTEAVALYAQHGEDIAVVVMDMMMPVLDGPATIRALLRMNPAVRIVAASGIAANGDLARQVGGGVKHFLSKPYTAETILVVLQQILEEHA